MIEESDGNRGVMPISEVAESDRLRTSAEVAMTTRRPLDITGPSLAKAAQRSPLDLIESTIRMGATLEQTREVILLARDMEQYDARKQFFAALAAFKAEVGPIFKNKTTKEIGRDSAAKFTYTWASLDSIETAIGPFLSKHGLSYTWDHEQEGQSVTTLCHVRHLAGHVETTKVKLGVAGSPGMSETQKVMSTMQYGRRASLTSALGLSTTEDDPNASGASTEKVSDEQVTTLNDSLQDTEISVARFLKYMGVESVVDILAADMPKAVSAIQSIYRQQKKEAEQ